MKERQTVPPTCVCGYPDYAHVSRWRELGFHEPGPCTEYQPSSPTPSLPASIREALKKYRATIRNSERDSTRHPSDSPYLQEVYDREDDAKAALEAHLLALVAKAADQRAAKDGAYEERNRVVAALARTVIAHGGTAGVARTAIEGWSEDWHGCVYIDLPCGQASWHFHESQRAFFAGLPPYTHGWDGHTTAEKYARLETLATPRSPHQRTRRHMPETRAGLYQKFTVTRTDGTSAEGQKHDGCDYFVLDLTHDKYAEAAIKAYAEACRGEYPELASDLRQRRMEMLVSRCPGLFPSPGRGAV